MDVFGFARSGLRAADAAVNGVVAGATAAAGAVGSVASAGLELAAIPLREGVKVLSGEGSDLILNRRCSHGDGRAWIEVRGLAGPDGAERGRVLAAALQGRTGVTAVSVNRPLSRVVVEIDEDATSLRDLCAVVDAAEQTFGRPDGAGARDQAANTGPLPGDGLLLATRGALVGFNAAGLAIAVVGRTMRWPAAPIAVDAVMSLANYQPWVRGLLEDRIGAAATDTVLSVATTTAHIVTLSPSTLLVDLMVQGLKAAESRAEVQAWSRYEPVLARHAEQAAVHPPARPVPLPPGAVQRHGKRVAFVQAIGAGVVGALTRNLDMASKAAMAASPKGMRTTREAFATTLGRGLADRHAVLTLRPERLRDLDRVDALLIDPRVLCTETLRIVQIRGADQPAGLSAAWERAQGLLDEPGLKPGWHPVSGAGRRGSVEALILPAQDALASAVVLEARGSGAQLVSVDAEILGELRTAFDELHPAGDGDLDAALAAALAELQQAGRTVAVLSSTAAQALSSADVALGVMPADDTAPPWNADLLLADLAGAWQVLHALPAAKEATQNGITISIGASAMGGLLMVPGVRAGRGPGPGPVTLGAGAGLLSGYLLARRVIRTRAPRPAPAYEWHAMSVDQVRDVLVPAADTEAHRMLAANRGPAETETETEHVIWQFAKAVREELSDPMTPILALCSAATAVLGSPIDAVMVGLVLGGNSMLAAGQRLSAENRLNALLAQQTPPARTVVVADDGTRTYSEVVAERLLPGEIIEVRSNEVVPADARVIAEEDLEVDESSLTGESLSVDKQVAATPGVELAERACMLYAGTTVVAGTALAMVTAVGPDTQTRRAAELASGELPVVGLQHHLSQLVSRAFPVSAGGGAVVGALGMLRGGGLRVALGNAIAVAIAAVPEGMPLMATLAQHASSQRLSKTGALVRIPRSVEALGRVNVVCFDKTGTLSENRLRVTKVHPMAGFSPEDVLGIAAQAAPAPAGAAYAHATDQAIVEGAAAAAGVREWIAPDAHLPFRSGRAFSASVVGSELTVKGAPEVVLDACEGVGADVAETVAAMAARGLRVITVARGSLTAAQAKSIKADPDRILDVCGSGLSLTGFLGLSDTPRPGASQLLTDLADRGVDIRMITGDHPITAKAIVAEMGLTVADDELITGSEWNALSRKEQERAVTERVIFARMSPENKVQIVQTLERAGRVTAMVGDGANDAAAIRAATVGLGVVAHGSDSAHATADVVLTDGNIGALADAIDEGRRLWRGVQLAISGLLGGNAGEVVFSIIGTALTGNSPLNTRQLLLMNTLTDALPATAVAVSTPAGPIQGAVSGIDERQLWRAVAFRGAVTAAAGTTAWAMASVTGLPARASTVALIALVCAELGQTVVDSQAPLVLLTAGGSLAVFMAMVSTPGVSQLLGCTPVGPIGWAQGLGAAGAATLAVAAASRFSAGRLTTGSSAPELVAAPEPAALEVAPQPTLRPVAAAPDDAPAKKVTKTTAKKVTKAAVKKAPAKKPPAKKVPVKTAAKAPVKKAARTAPRKAAEKPAAPTVPSLRLVRDPADPSSP